MKTYSIGRDVNCDIVINDSTDVISRRHAILTVTSSGKMTIIDQSSNGTYVNGIRISPNVPVPVTRKDTISLAHVTKLDWSMIPKYYNIRYIIFVSIGFLIVIGTILSIKIFTNIEYHKNDKSQISIVDSINVKKKEQARRDSLIEVSKTETLNKDSIKKITKEQKDSIERIKKIKEKKKYQKNSNQNPKEIKKKQSKPKSTKQDIG